MALVELQRFPENAAASLVQGMLEQEGIPAKVHRVSRYAGMGGSGYMLRVGEKDLAKARKLIARNTREVDMDEYVDKEDRSYRRCTSCTSVMINRTAFTGSQKVLMGVTLGLAWFFLTKDFCCRKCGHAWRSR